jgi:ATP-dependent helicase/nuclease subunit B
LAIVDIKTGTEPSKAAMKDAREPQMPLEAAIALYGGFGDLKGRQTAELAIWRLGGKGNGKLVDIAGDDVVNAAKIAWAGAHRMISAYDDVATPYLSEPRAKARFSDYRGLARRMEDVEDDG